MPDIALIPLSADAFAPYGEVFIPPETTARRDHVAILQNGRPAARPNLFLARTTLTALPHRAERMESHPHSSQTFVPQGTAPMPLAVALPGPDGQPDPATLRAFLNPGYGFSYRAGVWHLPIASLGSTVAVLGFMYEDGTAGDCVWAEVSPFTLVAP